MSKFEKPKALADFVTNGTLGKKEVKNKSKDTWHLFSLRIRQDLLDEIDDVLEKRVGISKTAWILEAIQQKLKRKDNG